MSESRSAPPLLDRAVKQMIARKVRGSALVRRALRAIRGHGEIAATVIGGATFLLRPSDYVDWSVLRFGYYESEILEALLEAIPHSGTVWDIGANFGLHAITIKLLRPDVTVVCFEPSPDQAARILRHSELNHTPVTVLCVGLGRTTGPAKLYIPQKNAGTSTFVPCDGKTYDDAIYSYIVRADDILNIAPVPDVIKMDIEGSESDAIAGMDNLLSTRRVKRLIIENGETLAPSIEPYGYRLSRGIVCSFLSNDPPENFVFDLL